MTPAQKRHFNKIIQIAIIFLGAGILYGLIEYGILGNSKFYPSTKNPYLFSTSLIFVSISASIVGLLIGTIETKLVNKLFVTRAFWQKIAFKTTLYIIAIITVLLLSSWVLNSFALGLSLFHPEVIQSILSFLKNFSFWSIIIYAGVILILTLFIAEVSDYLGGSVFNNFFTGKYHHPREEERIFMFLDMNSSTTIAESLGHMEYFHLLKKYYADVTEAIIQTDGEVYQYAGDEVIVSWSLKKGLVNNNCIECFFMIKNTFQASTDAYMKRFGLVPAFKAGFHYGKVTTGEIGVLKKEIFFTGDVLNTTSRIQTSCKQYETDILVSTDLLSLLSIDDRYSVVSIGESELKGRLEKVDLFTIKKI